MYGYRAEFTETPPVCGAHPVREPAPGAGWPVEGESGRPEVSASGADEILLVGTTGDPATPYEGALRLRGEPGEGVGVLPTYDGEGHGAYPGGNVCVVDAVDGHLLSGATSPDGTTCT